MNKRAQEALKKTQENLVGWGFSDKFSGYVVELAGSFLEEFTFDRDFSSAIASNDQHEFFTRLWEMQLWKKLKDMGLAPQRSQEGPDFLIKGDGGNVWIEAIVPKPEGIPKIALEGPRPGRASVYSVPHEEVLLRWTSALKDKRDRYLRYLEKEVLSPSDAYVIAINGGRLGYVPLEDGISRYPVALECVYPLGPWAVPIDTKSNKIGVAQMQERYCIKKGRNNIPTDNFLNDDYVGVSAIFGCSRSFNDPSNAKMICVHNYKARKPYDSSRLVGFEVWSAKEDGEMLQLLKR